MSNKSPEEVEWRYALENMNSCGKKYLVEYFIGRKLRFILFSVMSERYQREIENEHS
jgi:hypothetical protein